MSGLYYKHIMIVNYASRVVSDATIWSITPESQTQEVLFTLNNDVYSTCITYHNSQLTIGQMFIVQATDYFITYRLVLACSVCCFKAMFTIYICVMGL